MAKNGWGIPAAWANSRILSERSPAASSVRAMIAYFAVRENMFKINRPLYPFIMAKFPPLVQAGIITSTRGKRGGLAFAHPPEEISLAETIREVEGDRLMLDCPFSLTPCGGQEDCPLAPLWDPVRQKIVAFLEATSLAQVAKRRKR